MHRSNGSDRPPASPSSVLAELVDRLTAQLQAGAAVDWDEEERQHPEHAAELRRLRPALGALDDLSRSGDDRLSGVAPAAAAEPLTGVLGDYRILREVGRGGMGVVYEAEQVSLGRRVALKVLPFAAALDSRHLQRFHNEARAAAGLHHSHIVTVYGVGCERGVHFYAMQFIDGPTLADLLARLRRAAEREAASAAERTIAHPPPEGDEAPAAAAETPLAAALSTERAGRGREYYRTVARWGVQAAEALDYAHQVGVVHRDVKPGNLLVEHRGQLWVTDFGLARIQAEASLTATGDLVGTLRYMSPEQALAKRVVIDHRTDVYSLGATLYELLALRPVFGGSDRQELLRQIAFEEPVPPRRLERSVPAELEVIVLKALEKNPAERYATAQELADDLGRFLEDRPIRARRPGLVQRLRKWGRRYRLAVNVAAACLLVVLAVVAGSVGWVVRDREARREDAVRRAAEALRSAEACFEPETWTEGLRGVEQAEGFLAGFPEEAALRLRARQLRRDLEMARQLQEARLQGAAVKDGHFDTEAVDAAYAAAFAGYGLDVDGLDPQAAAEQVRARPIHRQLVAALDDWAAIGKARKREGWRQRLAASRAADPDRWRNRLRDALEGKDPRALEEAAAADQADDWAVETLALLGTLARGTASGERVAALLGRAQQRHPDDFWINENLGLLLHESRPPRLEEAIRYYSIAVALRPQSLGAHGNLGNALKDNGRLDEAITEHREALRLDKDEAQAHVNLGIALRDKDLLEEAIAEYRVALRLKKDHPDAHNNLGVALHDKGRLEEAIAEYREAIRLKKDFPEAHANLGNALHDKGLLEEAIAEYREALGSKHDFPDAYLAHKNLGAALAGKGLLDEAIAEYRVAIRLKKDHPGAHNNLGNALRDKGQLEEAIAECREAIRLKQDDYGAHNNLGNALKDKGLLDEAIAEYHEAIRLKKDYPEAHNNLGNALTSKGQLYEAIAEFREAIRLKRDYAEAHTNLGVVLERQGLLEEAIVVYRKAIHLKKDFAEAHNNLGHALRDKGLLDEAIAEYQEALRINKDYVCPRLNLGLALEDKGRLDEAIVEYRKAIRLQRDFPLAHNNLGNALSAKGRPDEAIAEYRKAIRLKKDFPEAHNNLGNALKAKGQLDEAIAEYRAALRLKKDYAGAHWNLGGALSIKGQRDAALAELREAIRLKKDYLENLHILGNVLADMGALDEAIAVCREALRLKKDYPEARRTLGIVLQEKGQLDEAIAEYREALRLKKDLPGVHTNLGGALYKKGRLTEAIAELQEALRLNKDDPWVHNNLGPALWAKGRRDEAIAEYRQAIRLKKDYPEAHNNLGLALYAKGRRDEAIAEWREAIRLQKDYPDAHNNLGAALADKGLLDEAIAEYREALGSKHDFPDAYLAHNNLGAALRDKGRLDEAIAAYREALRLKPDYANAHIYLGLALLQQGQFRQAVEELRRGNELGSRNPGWPRAQVEAQLHDVERLAELGDRLPALLKGQEQPKGAGERLALAQLCQMHEKRYAAAARWYGEAFAAQPALAEKLGAAGSRYDAACAAALAGCGQGKDTDRLDDRERARLRRQALDWLRADLDAWGRLLDKGPDKAGPVVGQQLAHWLEDPDFNGVRGAGALARLPEAERRTGNSCGTRSRRCGSASPGRRRSRSRPAVRPVRTGSGPAPGRGPRQGWRGRLCVQECEARITPSLTATLLVAPYGIDSYGTLLMDGSGNRYGTTTKGGSSGLGTVFEVSAASSPLIANSASPSSMPAGQSPTRNTFGSADAKSSSVEAVPSRGPAGGIRPDVLDQLFAYLDPSWFPTSPRRKRS
jgi:tetratricopeptide (TPR) repeat protein